jgi:zinc/manganese transport system substrate-binding protein
VLEVPTRIDRALGDQHPMGNPHYNLDPVSMKQAAQAIADGLGRNYPEHASVFKKNLEAYTASSTRTSPAGRRRRRRSAGRRS